MHGAPAFKIDPQISQYAQKRANHLASSNRLQSVGGEYGENLHYYSSTARSNSYNCLKVTKAWYDKGSMYDYSNPESANNYPNAGTFTQIVWRETRLLGCGQAIGSDGKSVFTVCNYDPPGNLHGDFGENVRPLVRSSTNTRTRPRP
jgi:uncharacterized protein YkwD